MYIFPRFIVGPFCRFQFNKRGQSLHFLSLYFFIYSLRPKLEYLPIRSIIFSYFVSTTNLNWKGKRNNALNIAHLILKWKNVFGIAKCANWDQKKKRRDEECKNFFIFLSPLNKNPGAAPGRLSQFINTNHRKPTLIRLPPLCAANSS